MANEPIDIIGGINSLDDVLSGAGYALQQTILDDLRKMEDARAVTLRAKTITVLRSLLNAVDTLLLVPDDQKARTLYADAVNRLLELGEDQTILSGELES